MAITVYKQPEKVMLNKNPILLGLTTDNQYSTARVKASGKFTFTNYPAADDTITITLFDTSYVYTFKNYAAASDPLHIRRNDTSVYPNIASWIAGEVITSLNKSQLIRDYFTMEVTYDGSNYSCDLVSIDYGVDQAILLADTAANITNSEVAPVAGVIRPNYMLFCSVYVTRDPDGDGFEKVAELELDPDSSGNVLFCIDRCLTIEDNEIPDDVEYESTSAMVHLRYKLFYGEKYGDEITYYPATVLGETSPLFALNGGFSDDVWPYISFYSQIINHATPKFLNLHPRKLTVSRDQPLWLYYFYNHSSGGYRIRCKLYDTIGGTSTITLTTSSINYTNNILAINASVFQHSGISGFADLWKYEIWVEKEDGTVVSERMMYLISEIEYEHNRYFLFRNSWGVSESLWCHGKADYNNSFSYETASVYVPPGSTFTTPASIQYGNTFERNVEISTGIKGREDSFNGEDYRNYLVDFFNSEERYELVDDKVLPIELLVKQEKFGSDMDTIFTQPFKYRYSFKSLGHTPSWL